MEYKKIAEPFKSTILLSIDLEDYYHTAVNRNEWEYMPQRLTENVDVLLKLFKKYGKKITWFTLGDVAERFPEILQKIKSQGHEIAAHSYSHQNLSKLSPKAFQSDIQKCKSTIFSACGVVVKGYRSPQFSVDKNNLWVFDILKEEGFIYDSSICPIKTPFGGLPGYPNYSFQFENGLWEFVIPTINFSFFKMVIAGGIYLRVFPLWITNLFLKNYQKTSDVIPVYLHPYDIDKDQVPINHKTNFLFQFLLYYKRSQMLKKLEYLLNNYSISGYLDYLKHKALI